MNILCMKAVLILLLINLPVNNYMLSLVSIQFSTTLINLLTRCFISNNFTWIYHLNNLTPRIRNIVININKYYSRYELKLIGLQEITVIYAEKEHASQTIDVDYIGIVLRLLSFLNTYSLNQLQIRVRRSLRQLRSLASSPAYVVGVSCVVNFTLKWH